MVVQAETLTDLSIDEQNQIFADVKKAIEARRDEFPQLTGKHIDVEAVKAKAKIFFPELSEVKDEYVPHILRLQELLKLGFSIPAAEENVHKPYTSAERRLFEFFLIAEKLAKEEEKAERKKALENNSNEDTGSDPGGKPSSIGESNSPCISADDPALDKLLQRVNESLRRVRTESYGMAANKRILPLRLVVMPHTTKHCGRE
jgi:hypothetical protein